MLEKDIGTALWSAFIVSLSAFLTVLFMTVCFLTSYVNLDKSDRTQTQQYEQYDDSFDVTRNNLNVQQSNLNTQRILRMIK